MRSWGAVCAGLAVAAGAVLGACGGSETGSRTHENGGAGGATLDGSAAGAGGERSDAAGGTAAGGRSGAGGAATGGSATGGAPIGGSGGEVDGGDGQGGTDAGVLPARGAVSLDFRAPEGCPSPAVTLTLPDRDGGAPVSADATGDLIVDDGLDGISAGRVACDIRRMDNGRYTFEGGVSVYQEFFRAQIDMFTQDAAVGERTVGGFGALHPALTRNFGTRGDAACYFEFFALELGRAWGKVECPVLPNFQDEATCALATSYFYFDHCGPRLRQ